MIFSAYGSDEGGYNKMAIQGSGLGGSAVGLVAVAMDSPGYSMPYETEADGIKTIYIYHDLFLICLYR